MSRNLCRCVKFTQWLFSLKNIFVWMIWISDKMNSYEGEWVNNIHGCMFNQEDSIREYFGMKSDTISLFWQANLETKDCSYQSSVHIGRRCEMAFPLFSHSFYWCIMWNITILGFLIIIYWQKIKFSSFLYFGILVFILFLYILRWILRCVFVSMTRVLCSASGSYDIILPPVFIFHVKMPQCQQTRYVVDLCVVMLEYCACEWTLCVLHLNCLSVCSLSAVNLCSVIEEAAALWVVYSEPQGNPQLLLLKQQVSTLEYWMYLFGTLCFDMFSPFFYVLSLSLKSHAMFFVCLFQFLFFCWIFS